MSLNRSDSLESVHQLGPGVAFKGRLLLVDKQRLLSRNSQPYLALVLRDRDGEIQGRAFRENARAAFEALEPGAMVDLSGRTQTFHGQRQIDIFNAQKVEGKDADPSQFTPATFLPVEELETMLDQQLDEVQNRDYRRLLEAVFQDPEIGQAFREGPATLHGHHNYRHGLLEHTVAVTWMASETAQIQIRLDRDLLICGALLHDIGRAIELKLTDVQIETTLVGSLIDHETLGTMLIAKHADTTGLTSPAREGLLHMISTHHKALTPTPGGFTCPRRRYSPTST